MSAPNSPCPVDYLRWRKARIDRLRYDPPDPGDRLRLELASKDYLSLCGLPPFITPSGLMAYGIEDDAILRVRNEAAAVVDSISYGSASSVDATQMAWAPHNKIALFNTSRQLRQFTFDEGSETLSQDWSINLSTNFSNIGYGLLYDKDGNILLALNRGGSGTSDTDRPIRKYDSDGNLLWSSKGGINRSDIRSSLAHIALATGNIHYSAIGINWNTGHNLNLSIIARLNPNDGTPIWQESIYTKYVDSMVGLPDGGVVIAYGEEADFDLEGSYQWYDSTRLRKYDSDGNQVWDILAQPGFLTKIRKVRTDLEGNVYIGGLGNTTNSGGAAKYSPGSAVEDPSLVWENTVSSGNKGAWDMDCDGENYLFSITHPAGRIILYNLGDGTTEFDFDADPSTSGGVNKSCCIHPGNPATIADFDVSLLP